MLFNSAAFLYFFLIVTALYFALGHAARIYLLLVASFVFYMWLIPVYATILVLLIFIDYFAGILIDRSAGGRRKAWLAVSLLANVGLLGFFKYYNFANENLTALLAQLGRSNLLPYLDMALPVGLSFHTFQSMSYTIEVYRGHEKAERSLPIYAIYVMFFPQLVAGPIERPQNLLHQFRSHHAFSFPRFAGGMRLIVWGLFKKVAIADLVAAAVTTVYGDPQRYSGPLLLLATFFFTIQIYCDFSGYSDIALGTARILGYDLMVNFRQPYFATSISEFWRRWHISLSTWFRDYLYIPLGGNRVSAARNGFNLLTVFVVSGLWHGAAWTFVLWGLLHGVYLIAGLLAAAAWARLAGAGAGAGGQGGGGRSGGPLALVRWAVVFVLVMLSWVLFRAKSLGDAWHIYSHLGDWSGFQAADLWVIGLPRFEMVLAFALIGLLFAVDAALRFDPPFVRRLWALRSFRWPCYLGLVYGIACFAVLRKVEFIYFQF
jgi:D-alanyl-lipoteichoic acid acyltransferase DltB (MBOAT superfamily)